MRLILFSFMIEGRFYPVPRQLRAFSPTCPLFNTSFEDASAGPPYAGYAVDTIKYVVIPEAGSAM